MRVTAVLVLGSAFFVGCSGSSSPGPDGAFTYGGSCTAAMAKPFVGGSASRGGYCRGPGGLRGSVYVCNQGGALAGIEDSDGGDYAWASSSDGVWHRIGNGSSDAYSQAFSRCRA